jgi:hypothetical protein
MALSKQTLRDDLKSALSRAGEEQWSLDQVAQAWADAIHKYVSAADVTGVTCSVTVSVPLNVPTPSQGTGTATQNNQGRLT